VKAFVAPTDQDWFEFLLDGYRAGTVDEVNFWMPNPWGGRLPGPGPGAAPPLQAEEPPQRDRRRRLLHPLHRGPDQPGLVHVRHQERDEHPGRDAGPDRSPAERASFALGRLHDRVHPPGRALLLGAGGLDPEPAGMEAPDRAGKDLRPDRAGRADDLGRRDGAARPGALHVGHRVRRPRGNEEPQLELPGGYGEPVLRPRRIGQGIFRSVITDVYGRTCSVTGEKALPVLDAAHIRPFSETQDNFVQNGLLLRSDVHRLFDAGYVTVTPELRVEASRRMKDDFNDGDTYLALHGSPVRVPDDTGLRPDPEALRWHNEERFRG
jgi:hypothetical protein